MPNYIKNRLHFSDKNIISNFLDKDGNFDFNTIIPMPKELNISSSSLGKVGLLAKYGIKTGYERDREEAQKTLDGYSDEYKKEAIELADKYYFNRVAFGFSTWYDWSIANWGVKWNASTLDVKNNIVEIQTAWSSPLPIVRKISNLYPDLELTIEYADEDTGSNCGRIKFLGGKPIDIFLPESCSKDAYDLYFLLHPEDKEYYKLIGDTYEAIED